MKQMRGEDRSALRAEGISPPTPLGLLDALGVQRAHVVGASMGGMIAPGDGDQFSGSTAASMTSIMVVVGKSRCRLRRHEAAVGPDGCRRHDAAQNISRRSRRPGSCCAPARVMSLTSYRAAPSPALVESVWARWLVAKGLAKGLGVGLS